MDAEIKKLIVVENLSDGFIYWEPHFDYSKVIVKDISIYRDLKRNHLFIGFLKEGERYYQAASIEKVKQLISTETQWMLIFNLSISDSQVINEILNSNNSYCIYVHKTDSASDKITGLNVVKKFYTHGSDNTPEYLHWDNEVLQSAFKHKGPLHKRGILHGIINKLLGIRISMECLSHEEIAQNLSEHKANLKYTLQLDELCGDQLTGELNNLKIKLDKYHGSENERIVIMNLIDLTIEKVNSIKNSINVRT